MGRNCGPVGRDFSIWKSDRRHRKISSRCTGFIHRASGWAGTVFVISYAEWFCIAMIVLGLIWNLRMMPILLMGAIGIFMIQQIGLTPILQVRSDQIIAGLSPDHSNVHVLYAILEVMKFICLLIYSSRV